MENFEELSLNIRTAFRLLAYYNQRILNLMNHIKEKLNLNTVEDKSYHYEPVIENSKNLEKRHNSMNWLPMFFHEFLFENRNIKFSVFILSDSGPWDLEDWNNIDEYTDINSSKTRIIFAITNFKKWDVDDIYKEHWYDFINDDCVITKNNKTIICKSFKLVDFKDEKTTNDTLKKYVEYVQTKGIENIKYIVE